MAISVKLGERKVWKVNVGVASTGTKNHNKLENRDAKDQHPMSSISGLDKALEQKAPSSHQHKKEDITDFPKSLPASDVYDWAKQPQKPSYTASEVKARPDNWTPSATDVGAHPNTWLPTPEQIGAAPALDWSHLKWYVMGDSLTAQDNAFTNKRYYDFVQEKTGIQVIVDGVGATGYKAGESEGQSFLDRVKNIPEDVNIVTIFGSGNDLKSTDTTYANAAIYDTLAWILLNRCGLRVIVVPPSPWRNFDKRGEVWKAYCDRLQVCALACDFRYLSDMYDCPPFNGKYDSHVEKFFTNDPNGVHPNEEGHKALAPYFYNALLEELALDESVVVSPGGSGGSGGAVDIPTTLPNPHKLTFTGAVQAEYDGSEAVSVEIPQGGGSGGTKMELIHDIVVEESVNKMNLDMRKNGQPVYWRYLAFVFVGIFDSPTGKTGSADLQIAKGYNGSEWDQWNVKVVGVFNSASTTIPTTFAFHCEKEAESPVFWHMSRNGMANVTAPISIQRNVKMTDYEYIQLYFPGNSTDYNIGAGTKIKIWGIEG